MEKDIFYTFMIRYMEKEIQQILSQNHIYLHTHTHIYIVCTDHHIMHHTHAHTRIYGLHIFECHKGKDYSYLSIQKKFLEIVRDCTDLGNFNDYNFTSTDSLSWFPVLGMMSLLLSGIPAC